MEVFVLFFGQLTDITGCASIRFPLVADTDLLDNELKTRYPQLKQIKYVIAVNQDIIRQCTPLSAGAEVALLPPFSGG